MKHREYWLALALFALALSLRLVPLAFSSQPFNIDGFPLVRIAEGIVEHGSIDTASYNQAVSYNTKMPAYSLLLSEASLLTGYSPMELAGILIALFTSLAVIMVYAIVRKISGSDIAGFAAGLFMAVNGLTIYFNSAVMKETVGLALLPALFYLYWRREDWRCRTLASGLLLLVPFVHHLTTLVAFIFVILIFSSQTAASFIAGKLKIKELAIDILSGPALFIPAFFYYSSVKMEFYTDVSNINDSVLLASVVFIAVIFTIILAKPTSSKPWYILSTKEKIGLRHIFDEKVLVIIIAVIALLANRYVKIFTGTINTSDRFVDLAIPYILLMLFALLGFNLLRYADNKHRPLIMAAFLAPISIIVYSFLRGLDPFSLNLVYRSYNFMDLGIAVSFGIGAGFIVAALIKRGAKAAAALSLVIMLMLGLACAPIAYSGEEMFGFKDVTEDYEFSAMVWADEHISGLKIGADQRASDVMASYFNLSTDKMVPLKIRHDKALSANALFLESRWTSTGAQFYPSEPIIIDSQDYNKLVESNNLLYSSGPAEDRVQLVVLLP